MKRNCARYIFNLCRTGTYRILAPQTTIPQSKWGRNEPCRMPKLHRERWRNTWCLRHFFPGEGVLSRGMINVRRGGTIYWWIGINAPIRMTDGPWNIQTCVGPDFAPADRLSLARSAGIPWNIDGDGTMGEAIPRWVARNRQKFGNKRCFCARRWSGTARMLRAFWSCFDCAKISWLQVEHVSQIAYFTIRYHRVKNPHNS